MKFTGRNLGGKPAGSRAETELLVLGHVALDSDAAEIGFAELTGVEFSEPDHQRIWQLLRAAHFKGEQYYGDVAMIADTITRGGFTDEQACVLATRALDQVAHAAHVEYYVGMLKNLHQRDQLKLLANRLAAAAADPSVNTESSIGQFITEAEALRAGVASSGLIDVPTALAALDARDEMTPSTTGLKGLDAKLNGGLRAGQLMVIGGRPGLGKSALMQQLLLTAAKQHQPVLLASLEMPAAECAGRGVRQTSRQLFEQLPVVFTETAELHQLVGQVRLAVRKFGVQLVAIDYLQLIDVPKDRGALREQQIAMASRAFKRLAVDLKIPVIVGSQLNRAAESRGRPSLADLRESGAIEQDADIVVLLHHLDDEGGRELIIAKHRAGSRGMVQARFSGERFMFEDLSGDLSWLNRF